MDNKNLTIAVLGITAVILLVGVIIVNSQPQPALASAGPGIESGDYILATGQFLPDEHLLYVIDAVSQRMIVYRFDIRTRQSFSPTDGVDLALLREQAAQADPQQPQPRSGRSRGRGRGRP
ncbi:MAG: hypothetical protein KAV82_13115 [Phycisphaerae bacterium]|nr:hypothetical protein [Phycisphaerae bacterium]